MVHMLFLETPRTGTQHIVLFSGDISVIYESNLSLLQMSEIFHQLFFPPVLNKLYQHFLGPPYVLNDRFIAVDHWPHCLG